ncbi:1-(5-phosphoribosyl)-5-[(5-phosphoribosylamino)methylideneamino]imidazole-4-carboxamide isomerase [Ferruginibacter sp. HRS2-29]|uniref:1-(5-phosphoribosyl)-5-[(5- phosphoribosylamino)methylideneamino]imidazole-4- carboxamide isomerase n=1 Tax=Ferruginibacter sp. HRS2-29 TaxID=2487334 RepID=UPI0020CFDF20|nr:1-(5-phosphoribosyl)-5-[(5-phosphoribosylamino)methylideneamino]imidazole-4-carboxamide isomerase [Ferruginibacter sp. HRS2-29]MCP9749869.1 1-(5-phosphoribosyl)-5-[(5-phosphoribosylamino)methylideneamino]imidazole-4-carboxamide isomerase [Ferruginibacter sp. HRS2-29]
MATFNSDGLQERSGEFIVPAIDIMEGKCVRLTKGDYATSKIYSDDPVEVAKRFEAAGIKRLHIVDLDGARKGQVINFEVLEKVASSTSLKIDFGGGVKKIVDVKQILDAGAAMVTIGSLAVKEPLLIEEWLMEFGADKFFIGADVLEEKVKISGWLEDGGVNIFDFIGKIISLGTTNIFCTDIAKDGVLQGPSTDLYKAILMQHPETNLVASGGVSSTKDIQDLKDAGCSGVIIGKALYEGNIRIEDLSIFNS